MGTTLFDELKTWHEGVVTHASADLLPPAASPRGRNSYLFMFGAGTALPAKRFGMKTMNLNPVPGATKILGQVDYRRQTAGEFTSYHLLISANGRLDTLVGNTPHVATTEPWDSATSVPFTPGDFYPDSALANNLAFICNGQPGNNKKASLEAGMHKVRGWGLERPFVGSLTGAAGAAGQHLGTYELRVTFYSSHTGHESSASETAAVQVVTSNQAINWSNIPVSASPEVTHRYLYVRNVATMPLWRRSAAMVVPNNTATTFTTSEADLNLVIIAPDTEENNPPPTLSACEWHASRMFAVGPDAGSNLLYSKLGKPEAFDPEAFEFVNPDDGQRIEALHSAHGVLMIFKRDAFYVLDGDDPASWTIHCVDPKSGCVSPRSIMTIEGITYWWSEHGPMTWHGEGVPTPVASGPLAPTINIGAVNFASLHQVCAGVGEARQHLFWAIPRVDSVRCDGILPFNYRLQRWISDLWDPMDVCSIATVVDNVTLEPTIMFGNYQGQVFRWWDGGNDGVPSGSMQGFFLAASATITTFTDPHAIFATIGNGLKERILRVFNPVTGLEHARRVILSNTVDTLTFEAVPNLIPDTPYDFTVGGPDFQWDTYWSDFGTPFWKKRYEFLYSQFQATTSDAVVYIDLFLDHAIDHPVRTFTVQAIASGGSYWGRAVWDVDLWGGIAEAEVRSTRHRVARTGKNWRARVRNHTPDEGVTLMKLACRAEQLTDKR